jgi:opacity protein-like surface antigen
VFVQPGVRSYRDNITTQSNGDTMKRIPLVLLCVVILAPGAFAGTLVGFGFQATGAQVNFPEPVKDYYNRGFGGGAHLDIGFVPAVGIRLVGDYVVFSPDNDKLKGSLVQANPGSAASDFSIDGGQINFLTVSLNLKFGVPSPIFSPYLTGGAGSTSVSTSDIKVSYRGGQSENFPGAKAETKFSANLGGGVELKMGITLYVETKYTWIFTEGETSTYVPVSIGITF